MAQPIPCDSCTEEMATVLLTLIDEADVKGFGPDCFADFAEAFIRSVRPELFAPAAQATRGRGRKKAGAADGQAPEEVNTSDNGITPEAGTAAGDGQSNDAPAGATLPG